MFLTFSRVQASWFYTDQFPWVTSWEEMLGVVLILSTGIALIGLIVFILARRILSLLIHLVESVAQRQVISVALLLGLGHLCLALSVMSLYQHTPEPRMPSRVPPRVDTSRRVVLIGLDGATFRVMKPLLAKGELPNFQTLIDRGAHGPLRTLAPSNSPVLWTTIATGVRREKHRVMNFMIQHPWGISKPILTFPSHIGLNTFLLLRDIYGEAFVNTYPVIGANRRSAAVWEIANAYDLSVSVVNWWPSWPAQEVNGVMVSDRLLGYLNAKNRSNVPWDEALQAAAAQGLTSPPELLNEIESTIESSEMRGDGYHQWMQIGLHLFDRINPDLFLLYFKNGPDEVQHGKWDAYEPELFRSVPDDYVARHKNDIPDMYRKMDRLLGNLLNIVGEKVTVIVVSDHGGSPFFAVNPWSPWTGGHEHCPPGIFIAAGPGIRRGIVLEKGSILDITPTILALLGLPSAESMDGEILSDILDDDVVDKTSPRVETWDYLVPDVEAIPIKEISEEEEERLRALGYVR